MEDQDQVYENIMAFFMVKSLKWQKHQVEFVASYLKDK